MKRAFNSEGGKTTARNLLQDFSGTSTLAEMLAEAYDQGWDNAMTHNLDREALVEAVSAAIREF